MTIKTFKRSYIPLLVAACFGVADAAPTLPQVVAGQATFTQQGNVFSITNTPNTIINWQSFSVNAGEVTRFVQQSADSAVLNRILGQDPSKILGALQSNGKVFLINPNGIVFGRDARVDVNGLVASTLNLSNADFLAGKKNFVAGTVAGDLANDGTITTPSGGQVFLIAPNVSNNGIVASPNGEVVLAAGRSVRLVDSSDPDMHVVVSAPADQAINLGQLVAQGGKVGIYGALVTQRGVVNANSAQVGENGKIVFKASRDTLLEQGSVTSATGAGKGGTIHLLGERVGLAGDAQVDASGAAGGGTVLVGGDWQGRNALLPNARRTWMGPGATIRADAREAGDGGKVVLWSDAGTQAFGAISARGGAHGGNGGQVETSGHYLDVTGLAVNAGAVNGKAGSWLLDPYDIEVVVAGATAGVPDVAAFAGGLPSGLTKVAPGTLTAGTNIVLQAQHDLTITDAISTAYDVSAQAGHDITVNAAVATSGGNLDFRAGNNFLLGAGGKLQGGKTIGLQANAIALLGTVGGAGGHLPTVTLTSYDPAMPIEVRSGSAIPSDFLWLDAASLQAMSAYQVNIGSSVHQGPLSISAPVAQSANIVLDNAGRISIGAPVDLSRNAQGSFRANLYGPNAGAIAIGATGSVTAGRSVVLQGDSLQIEGALAAPSVRLMPHNAGTAIAVGGLANEVGFSIGQDTLGFINAGELAIGGLTGQAGAFEVTGALDLAKLAHAPATLILDAGAASLTLRAPVASAGTLALHGGAIYQMSDAPVSVGKLAVDGAQVDMAVANNSIGTLAGAATGNLFQVSATGALKVGQAGSLSGIGAGAASVRLVTTGALTLEQQVTGGSDVTIDAAGIAGTGTVKGNVLVLRSTGGIGAGSAPLHTEAKVLMAYNQGAGARPINVSNVGGLTLDRAVQDGEGNTGAITIDNVGGMIVPAYTAGDTPSLAHGLVSTSSGDISLTTHSPLTISGDVRTNSGNVRLVADNAGLFTANSGAHIASATGEVTVVAGSTAIADGTIMVSSPDKKHLPRAAEPPPPPPPPPPPTLDVCLIAPSVSGCADVLATALQACIANPDGPNCGAVLPTVTSCTANPSAPGCQLVLAREALNQCIANPKGAGCEQVLPPYATCAVNPATAGCAPVIAARKAVEACIANPKGAGCASTLPPLDACRADGTVFGCAPVLARAQFDACLVNPGAAGCAAVLPPLPSCKANPAQEGCSQVLQVAFSFCLTHPNDASCSGILPTLSQCVANKSLEGCGVVLPTLAQCIGSPTLQGCGAILPTLAQCAASPAVPGCEAVLPAPSFCTAHPTDATCQVFNPTTGQQGQEAPVVQAGKTTVNLINTSTAPNVATGSGSSAAAGDGNVPAKPVEKKSGPAPTENSGAKNEKPATKTYCN